MMIFSSGQIGIFLLKLGKIKAIFVWEWGRNLNGAKYWTQILAPQEWQKILLTEKGPFFTKEELSGTKKDFIHIIIYTLFDTKKKI